MKITVLDYLMFAQKRDYSNVKISFEMKIIDNKYLYIRTMSKILNENRF